MTSDTSAANSNLENVQAASSFDMPRCDCLTSSRHTSSFQAFRPFLENTMLQPPMTTFKAQQQHLLPNAMVPAFPRCCRWPGPVASVSSNLKIVKIVKIVNVHFLFEVRNSDIRHVVSCCICVYLSRFTLAMFDSQTSNDFQIMYHSQKTHIHTASHSTKEIKPLLHIICELQRFGQSLGSESYTSTSIYIYYHVRGFKRNISGEHLAFSTKAAPQFQNISTPSLLITNDHFRQDANVASQKKDAWPSPSRWVSTPHWRLRD